MTGVLLMPQEAIDADRAGWLDRRTQGITGTDVASLMGLSSHMSAFGLYHAKRDGIETHDKPVMRRGRKLEPEIDDLWKDQCPSLLLRPAGLYASADRPWMLATLDRLTLDTEGASAQTVTRFSLDRIRGLQQDVTGILPAEHKTWATKDGWADSGGDGNRPGCMPVPVRAQAIWNMTVYGAPAIWVVVLWMTTWQLGIYQITADDPGVQRDLQVMMGEAERFRRQLITGDEPPVDAHPATTDTLRKLHPDLTDESVRVPAGLKRRYDRARAAKKTAEDRLKLVQNELRYRMGSAARAHAVIDGEQVKVCSRSIGDTPVKAFTRHDDRLNPTRGRS